MPTASREAFSHWAPTGLCSGLILMAMFLNPSAIGPILPFLPFCFALVAMVHWNQRKQILELQQQVAELRQTLALPALEKQSDERPVPGFQITLLQALVIATFAALLMAVSMAVLRG